jgi:hypothetical protein
MERKWSSRISRLTTLNFPLSRVCDFSGFSEANRENLRPVWEEEGWVFVGKGFEVWAFRWPAIEA